MRFEKRKNGSVTAIEKHHERKKEKYKSNSEIDASRSKLNYHIKSPAGMYAGMIQKRLEILKCRVRKDSVLFVDTFVGASPEFMEKLSGSEQKEFLKHAYDFFAENVGEENILSAVVHLDEKTPHMHISFMPVTKDGRLSAKDVIGNEENLTKWQDNFYNHMRSKWNSLERGEPAKVTKRKHLSVQVYKKLTSEMKSLEKRIQDLQRDDGENISREDIALLKNQLREVKKKLQVADEKANAPIVEVEIQNDEKTEAVRKALNDNRIKF